jgi:uncharacterized protein (TIRG00374 family)
MHNVAHSKRRALLQLVKIGLAIGILSYLIVQVQRNDGFTRLIEEPKNWPLLVAGMACTLVAIWLNFLRWHFLIRAVGIDIRIRDTFRFGSLGYALNFVSPGAIGGDLFKAILLAREQRGRRTEAVLTVVADRLMGVMTILILASLGIVFTHMLKRAEPTLRLLCEIMLVAAFGGLVAVALLLCVPALSGQRAAALVHRVPLLGSTLARVLAAVHAYRDRRSLLAAAAGVSAVGNLMLITSVYLVASGLPFQRPTWIEHMILVPMANIVAALPITPAGFGTKEYAVAKLYTIMPSTLGMPEGDGALVTLAHRVTEIAVALSAFLYILSHRAEVHEVYEEAEELIEEESI